MIVANMDTDIVKKLEQSQEDEVIDIPEHCLVEENYRQIPIQVTKEKRPGECKLKKRSPMTTFPTFHKKIPDEIEEKQSLAREYFEAKLTEITSKEDLDRFTRQIQAFCNEA